MARPTARRQSALRTPLNDILGTAAHVRLLRVLTEARAPLSAAQLARRSQLQRSSVHRALQSLEATGLVMRVGIGTRAQLQLSPDHPLSGVIEALFNAERTRATAVVAGIKKAVAALSPPPASAWIEGPVANGSDVPGDPVILRLIDGASTLATATEYLNARLETLARRLDIMIEVRGSTLADIAAMAPGERTRLRDAIPLLGVPPTGFTDELRSATRATRSHAEVDARARAIGAAVAEKIAKTPSLIQAARARIALRLPTASSGERKELEEWDRILRTTSPVRLRQFLSDRGERATRLRQTMPFLGVLTAAERERVLKTIKVGAPSRQKRAARMGKTTGAKARK